MALAGLLLIGVGEWMRRSPPDPAPRERPDLQRWGMLGCWDLELEPWRLGAGSGERAAEADGGSGTESRSTPGAGRPPSSPPAATAGSAPDAMTAPRTVMLMPGTVDRWGRRLPSHRAVSVPDAARPERRLRWFVRADTLWIVWSEGAARAGVALFAEGDSMVGMARGVDRSSAVDGSARARAWRVNCATGEREGPRDRPRR